MPVLVKQNFKDSITSNVGGQSGKQLIMEQVQYQQQQFQGIVPVLDVGDASQSLTMAQAQPIDDAKEALAQLGRDASVINANAETAANELVGLAELSQKAAKTAIDFKNQQTERKLLRFGQRTTTMLIPLLKLNWVNSMKKTKEQDQLTTNVNTTVSGNVQRIETYRC